MVQPIDYSFIANAGNVMGGAIASLPDVKARRDTLKKQLETLKIDKATAEDIRLQRIAEAVVEYKEATGEENDDTAISAVSRYYAPATGATSQEIKNEILNWDKQDELFEKRLTDLKVKKFRSQNGQPVETEGPAGAGYQPPGTPQVQARQMPGDVRPGQAFTGGTDLSTMQRDMWKEASVQPRTTVPGTMAPNASSDMYQLGAAAGITETPEFKSDFQQQQNVEAGLLYQPGASKGEYVSDVSTMGIDPSTGTAKELGSSLMSDKDLADVDYKKQTVEIKRQVANDKGIHDAEMAIISKRRVDARTAEQKKLLVTDVMKLKVAAQNAKSRILDTATDNLNKLEELKQKSWNNADSEVLRSSAALIKESQSQAEVYDAMIKDYQDIIDGVSGNTITPKPVAIRGSAGQPGTKKPKYEIKSVIQK